MKAFYNMDYNSVDIIMDESCYLRFHKEMVEANLRSSPLADSKLKLLAEQEPLTYIQLYLSGQIQAYVNSIKSNDQAAILFVQYKQRYPHMTDSQIDSIIRQVLREQMDT